MPTKATQSRMGFNQTCSNCCVSTAAGPVSDTKKCIFGNSVLKRHCADQLLHVIDKQLILALTEGI